MVSSHKKAGISWAFYVRSMEHVMYSTARQVLLPDADHIPLVTECNMYPNKRRCGGGEERGRDEHHPGVWVGDLRSDPFVVYTTSKGSLPRIHQCLGNIQPFSRDGHQPSYTYLARLLDAQFNVDPHQRETAFTDVALSRLPMGGRVLSFC